MKYYKENFEEIKDKFRKIHDPEYRGTILQIQNILEVKDRVQLPKLKALRDWDFETQLYDFIDYHMEYQKLVWANRTDVLDDSFPSMYPRFGIAEHSAYLGGEVTMEENTSYLVPFIKDWSDMDNIHVDPNNKWLKRVLNGIEYIKEKGKDQIAPRLRGGCSPCELVNFIRGNDLFMDLYDYPDELHKLLKICTETEKWFIKQQKDVYGEFAEGGVIDGNSVWGPSDFFGHLSEDWSYMCSMDMYKEFGRPYTEAMLTDYAEYEMHLHSGGAHIIPEVADIKKLTYIQIVQDPNQPAPIDIFKKYEKNLEGKIVIMQATSDEIKQNVEFLHGKRVIFQVVAKTFAEAKDLTEFVHKELPVELKK